MFGKGASELVVTSPETEEKVVLKFDAVMGFKARGVGSTAAGAAFAPEFKKLWGKSKK